MWTIQSWYDTARAAAERNPDQIRNMAFFTLRNLENHLPGVPREEVVRRLERHNRERLDAVPNLTKYPELRGMRELIEAQWRGTRDGAKLDDTAYASYCNGHYYYHRYVCGGRVQHTAKCSCAYFPTSDHGPLFAANLDTSIDEPYGPPQWPTISEHLVAGGVSSGVFLDETSPEIFPAPVWTLVGRYARNVPEAVEMFERYNDFWGPQNAIVVDRQNEVAMIEKTSRRVAVRRSSDGFGYITAMTQEDPALRDFVWERRRASLEDRGLSAPCADTRYWEAQDRRRLLMNELLDEARRRPTLAGMQRFMQFRDPVRGNVAGDGDVLHPGDPPAEHTIRTIVWCLAEGRALWWTRDNDKNIPSWQNRREDVHFKDVWLWEDSRQADREGSDPSSTAAETHAAGDTKPAAGRTRAAAAAATISASPEPSPSRA